MALSTQYVRLAIVGATTVYYCIKDFPDVNTKGEVDQIEVTTLCDEYHEYIDGLKNYADNLEFTANYDESIFDTFYGYANTSEYSNASTYSVGDIVKHDGKLYHCTTAVTIAEDWDGTKWTAIEVELLLCESSSDYSGKNGKFTVSACDLDIRLSGGGVGDALEMVYIVKPKGAISFQTVA